MSKPFKIRKTATTLALTVAVLAPAGMVIGNASPASAVVSLGKLGRVEVNVGGPTEAGSTVKQIAAGNQDTAG